ncbi:MAG TPA: hypothetical protein VFR55_08405 [Dehalococcoidia bacterium]|nr:hypothetical protein [Dehalococcoidia bacterium]
MKTIPVILLATLLILSLACFQGEQPRIGESESLPDEQRAGSGGSGVPVQAQVTRMDGWDDDCQKRLLLDPQMAANKPPAALLAWRISTTETDSADAWLWSITASPDSGPSFIGDSGESSAWLCGVVGEYGLQVSAQTSGVWRVYTVAVRAE